MITIYGKENCTFCEQAKQLCKQKDVEFEYKQLGIHFERDEFINYMLREHATIVRAMPQIEQDGQYVGGFNELKEKLS